MAAPVSAQKPLRGCSRVSLVPMVRTMRQPPLIVPSPMAEAGCGDHPGGNVEVLLHSAGDQNGGDDAHRLLRVIGSVGTTEQSGRDQLVAAEMAVHLGGSESSKAPVNGHHQQICGHQADERGKNNERQCDAPFSGDQTG